jgi:hypothetical protein
LSSGDPFNSGPWSVEFVRQTPDSPPVMAVVLKDAAGAIQWAFAAPLDSLTLHAPSISELKRTLGTENGT